MRALPAGYLIRNRGPGSRPPTPPHAGSQQRVALTGDTALPG